MKLYDRLIAYASSDALGMHMPGHKRNTQLCTMDNPFAFDITEIDGFDNLHHPEDVLKESQQLAAEVYHTRDTRYLINGSTAGILAGISACTKPGDRILVARNCHKSVYHALIMQQLIPVYLHPLIDTETGIAGRIDPEEVKRILNEDTEHTIRLCVITSPTYEGILSDIKTIADLCHMHDIVLMVDEAHGAHLNTDPMHTSPFQDSALMHGADLVIQSVHKTLPSLTQTALLHRNSDRVSSELITFYLDIYQTSSPSYVLMASIDQCMHLMASDEWQKILQNWQDGISAFHEAVKNLKVLQVYHPSDEIYDQSKLVITTIRTSHSGSDLMAKLRDEYHIELEMASACYVIAMTGAGDTEENLLRFAHALCAIDAEWAEEIIPAKRNGIPVIVQEEQCLIPSEAFACTRSNTYEEKTLDASLLNAVSLDFLYVYPPGVPFVVPGEKITEAVLRQVKSFEESGCTVIGYHNEEKKSIRIIQI